MKTLKKFSGPWLTAVALFLICISGFTYAQNTGFPNSNFGSSQIIPQMKSPVENVSQPRGGATVTPNPSIGPIVVRYFSTVAGKVGITISKVGGSALLVSDCLANVGANQVAFDLSSFGAGNYSILVSGSGVYAKIPVVIK